MFAYLRHALAIIVFGVVIPIAAFFNTYPNGVEDFVNRIRYASIVNTGPTELLVLKTRFAMLEPGYLETAQRLLKAKEGEKLTIRVDDNFGGDASVLQMIQTAINKSKASVTVTLKHFGLSCGTYILGMGDYLVLPSDSLLLFHTGSHMGQKTTEVSAPGDTMNKEAFDMVMKIFAPYRGWITKEEFTEFKKGTDVWVTGADICLGRDGRKADVLYTYKGGCVIKGFRKAS